MLNDGAFGEKRTHPGNGPCIWTNRFTLSQRRLIVSWCMRGTKRRTAEFACPELHTSPTVTDYYHTW